MKVLKCKIQAANVVRVDGGQRLGSEQSFELVSKGGRKLSESETPDGVGALSPGDEFMAPAAWLKSRSHWHFLEVLGEGSSVPTTVKGLKAHLDSLGIKYPARAKKDDLLDLLGVW